MDSRLSRWCDGFLEAGWLIAIVVTPLFFNIHSERVFEPDKITLLRSIALMMSIAWIVKFIDGRGWQDLSWLKPKSENSIWKMPLVTAVFAVALIYIISTIFSVAPRTSIWGSYQRLQGTYTTLSYIVIFALIAATMRTRAQVQRVITAVIITSIPASMYGMLQKFKLDTLPWGGDTSRRVAGHMGNAIFLSAYLIMAFPLTAVRIADSFYCILTDEDLSYADVFRSSIYILALAFQAIAIVFTQSRGPILGLGIGMFAFVLILLVALRNSGSAEKSSSISNWISPLAFVAIAFGGLVVSAATFNPSSAITSFGIFGAVIGVLLLAILILAATRIGWQWLWAAWIGTLVFVGAALLVYNLAVEYPEQAAETPVVSGMTDMFDGWRQVPTIGRLGSMLNTETGNGTVRLLIWEGALDLIKPHEPLESPTTGSDKFNFLRPLIGYGPESMYVAYNKFYPPELATVEARNASPDRAHNETIDALVITGVAGFVAWQVLYLSVFYYGLRLLGVANSKRDRLFVIGFWIAGAVIATAIAAATVGLTFLGVSIPFGSILGLIAYLIYYAIFSGRDADSAETANPYRVESLIVVGLLAALIAYYIEIHFGIAIVATRLHSFAFMGLLFVIGTRLNGAAVEEVVDANVKARRSRTTKRETAGWLWPTAAATLIMAVLIGTLGFDFVNFTPKPGELENFRTAADIPGASEILSRALLEHPRNNFVKSPYLFAVVVFAWLFGSVLLVCEMVKDGTLKLQHSSKSVKEKSQLQIGAGVLALTALVLMAGALFALRAPDVSTTARIGSALAGLWGAIALASGVALFAVKDAVTVRHYAGGIAVLGVLFMLPALFAGGGAYAALLGMGSIAALFFLWEKSWSSYFVPLLIIGLISFFMGLFYMLTQAALLHDSFLAPPNLEGSERRIAEAVRVGTYLSRFYMFVFVLMIGTATALAWPSINKVKQSEWPVGWVALVALFSLGFFLVNQTNMNIIQADMVYKRGKPFDQQASSLMGQFRNATDTTEQQQLGVAVVENWSTTIDIYNTAIEMAPNEDFYYLFLGRALLEQSAIDQTNQVKLLGTAKESLLDAQAINPLNTDHTANLARLNARWAGYLPQDQRSERTEEGLGFYEDALSLSPQNSIIRNEYAGMIMQLDRDCERAIDTFEESIEVDPYYAQSYLQLAQTYTNCARSTQQTTTTGSAEGDDSADNLTYYENALTTLDKARDLRPIRAQSPERVRSDAARLEVGIAQRYIENQSYDRALEIIEEARDGASDGLIGSIDQLVAAINQQTGNE